MQDDKLPGTFATTNLRDHDSPKCTLGQNGCGARRVKARKYTCFLTLANNTALHACAWGEEKKREVTGRAGEMVVISDVI